MCTLELWKGLVFAHTCLMTEHMDNECHCAASYSKGNWDLRWKGKVFKKEFKKDCPPTKRGVCGSMDAEPCSEGQSTPLQPRLPRCGSVKSFSSKCWRFVLASFLSVAHIWRRYMQMRCCSVGQAENSVHEHLKDQTLNVEISDLMSYLFPSSHLYFICNVWFATFRFHFQALLS